MKLVGAVVGTALVDDIGDKVVCSWQALFLAIAAAVGVVKEVPELDGFDGEVDDGGIFFHVKSVLGEPLEVQYNEGGQLGDVELLDEVFLVRFVLLLRFPVELCQQVE